MASVAKPNAVPDALSIVEDAVCTACGCACDDIELTIQGGRIIEAARACDLGRKWFFDERDQRRPPCLVEGRPASIDEGVERAAQILAAARYALVYGLCETTCEAQRIAAGIADWIGGTVDTPTSIYHGPSGVTFQGVGEVTCSLGEIANRGDLVIFWGSNPAESHPRHFERYSLMPKGMFVPRGRPDRTCVVVDVRKTASAASADVFLELKPGRDFEALWVLRALALGVELDAREVESETGVPLAAWQDLIERMKRARFGVLLFGTGLTMTRGRHLNTEALLALVRDMNAYTRFVAKPMRALGNVAGADSVLAWRTGFPFGVNMSRGYPRFNPGEFTGADVLARGEADAALVVADDPMSYLDERARAHLAAIPLVSLSRKETTTTRSAAVAFTTATYGIHVGGTTYRMDDVPLPLRSVLTSQYPSDVDVLSAIERRIRELTAGSRVRSEDTAGQASSGTRE